MGMTMMGCSDGGVDRDVLVYTGYIQAVVGYRGRRGDLTRDTCWYRVWEKRIWIRWVVVPRRGWVESKNRTGTDRVFKIIFSTIRSSVRRIQIPRRRTCTWRHQRILFVRNAYSEHWEIHSYFRSHIVGDLLNLMRLFYELRMNL